MPTYKTIVDGVEALEAAMLHKERCEEALEKAARVVRELQRITLPPLFAASRQKKYVGEDGLEAVKRLGAYARWPKAGKSSDPLRPGLTEEEAAARRLHAIKFLAETNHLDALKSIVIGTWGKGERHLAEVAYKQLQKDTSARVALSEDIHWKTYENIVLDTFQEGKHEVPLTEIGAEVFDEVTITKRRETT